MAEQPLAGRNAIVVGVERPLGRQAAVALAEAGADVAVVTLSTETKSEFAANSTANEFWAIGRRGTAITTDGTAGGVVAAITSATAELGPIAIAIWHGPAPVPQDVLGGLRSDPAIVVLIGDDTSAEQSRALLEWTGELAASGLRANALASGAENDAGLERHTPQEPMNVAAAVVYLASDATAALEGVLLTARA